MAASYSSGFRGHSILPQTPLLAQQPPPIPPHRGKARMVPAEEDKPRAHFTDPNAKEERREQRSRILTMKYGKQQMMLIRKRLKVEMWLMEKLEDLCDDEDAASAVDMDIDDLLDADTDADRIGIISAKIRDSHAPQTERQEFIREFMEQLKTL